MQPVQGKDTNQHNFVFLRKQRSSEFYPNQSGFIAKKVLAYKDDSTTAKGFRNIAKKFSSSPRTDYFAAFLSMVFGGCGSNSV